MTERERKLAETLTRERSRLLAFIRKRLPEPGDAEDVLQDVFYEFIAAYRLPEPIEQAGAWLFRVARNRIIDLLRRRRPERSLSEPVAEAGEDSSTLLGELLPDPEAGPEAAYLRGILLDELSTALADLPEEQRSVFVAHEFEGRSFKELAEETGLSVNTLLGRKRYAVLHLRDRLQAIHEEFQSD